MKKWTLYLLLLIFTISATKLPIYETEYDNGLKLIVIPNHDVAVVSCKLYYFMGSYYEGPGSTGLSHLYEHMMFKGTKRIGTHDYAKEIPYMHKIDSLDLIISELKRDGVTENEHTEITELKKKIFSLLDEQRQYIKKDELWSLYQKNGGTGLNAWTSDDLTAYTVTLPANKVELFANIEADRMENLVLREFYSERDVVSEERRMRYENKPKNRYNLLLQSVFYTASPYRLPTIGWESDIQNYTRSKLTEHIKKYYRPDNAVVILAGNIDSTSAKTLIGKYFSHIKRPNKPLPRVVTTEPAPMGEKRFTVYAQSTPRVDIIYPTTKAFSEDLYKLDVIESILSGRSGRLYKRLVDDEKLCSSISAGNRWRKDKGMFYVSAQLTELADPKIVEKIILEEIEKLSKEEPTTEELERTINSIRFYFVSQLQKLESISDNVAYFENLGDWREIYNYEDKIAAVKTTSDVVKKYLNPRYKTVGTLLTETKETSNEK